MAHVAGNVSSCFGVNYGSTRRKGVGRLHMLGTLDLGLTTQHRMVDEKYDIIGLFLLFIIYIY